MLTTAAAAAALLVTLPLAAQGPGTGAGAGTAKKAAGKGYDAARRVPPYFGQVGLSAEQREAIYKIRAQHLGRIETLQQQIEQEESQMMTESEAVLTDAQRRLLEDRRGSARDRSRAAPKDADPGSTKPASGPSSRSPR
jgi:hypothetical protein